MKKASIRKKKKISLMYAVLHILARPNNTIISLCKENGDVVSKASCGTLGFKNCRKSVPHATQTTIKHILGVAMDTFAVKKMDVIIKGAGLGRESVLSYLQGVNNIEIISIQDKNSLPYGGVRWPRARRV